MVWTMLVRAGCKHDDHVLSRASKPTGTCETSHPAAYCRSRQYRFDKKALKTLGNSRKERQRGGRQESHSTLKRKSLKSLKSLEVWLYWRALVPRHRYSKLSATFSKTASNELPRARSDMTLWCTIHIKKFHRKGFDTTGATGTTGLGTRARDQGPGCQQGVSTRLYEALKIKDL